MDIGADELRGGIVGEIVRAIRDIQKINEYP